MTPYILMAAGFLALTALVWIAADQRVQAERTRANEWKRIHDDRLDDLTDARQRHLKSTRRALVAEATVTALTNDLAKERRANTLLRTGILDAEREAMEMADVIGLPTTLSERRAAR